MVIALNESRSGKITRWLPNSTEYDPMRPEDDRISPDDSQRLQNITDDLKPYWPCLLQFLSQLVFQTMLVDVSFLANDSTSKLLTQSTKVFHKTQYKNIQNITVSCSTQLYCWTNMLSTLIPGNAALIYCYATHLNVTQRAHLFLVVWRDSRDLVLGGMAWHTSSLFE